MSEFQYHQPGRFIGAWSQPLPGLGNLVLTPAEAAEVLTEWLSSRYAKRLGGERWRPVAAEHCVRMVRESDGREWFGILCAGVRRDDLTAAFLEWWEAGCEDFRDVVAQVLKKGATC